MKSIGYEKEWNDSYGLDKDPVRINIVYPWIINNLDSFKHKIILDAGCGNGSFAAFIKGQDFREYIGIDISDIFLDFAKKKVVDNRITFKKGNLLSKWDFSDKYFDLVFSIFVINEINNLDFFFSEISRVLNKNGTAIIFVTHPFVYMYYSLKEKFTGKINKKFPGFTNYFQSTAITYNLTLSNASSSVFPYTISDIFNSISNANMFVNKISELTTNSSECFLIPKYKETSDIPKFLALKLVSRNYRQQYLGFM